jgi:ketosteroid isomerase-like protein
MEFDMSRFRLLCSALTLALVLGLAPSTFAQKSATDIAGADGAAISRLLNAQVEAWNHGDLEGYMEGYWRSEELTFFAGGTVTRGWEATLARYRKRYQSAGKASMGKLDLSELEIQALGPDAALVRGRWHLAMADGKQLGGLTTLILRRMPAGWRIVHDHSCSD